MIFFTQCCIVGTVFGGIETNFFLILFSIFNENEIYPNTFSARNDREGKYKIDF
jgi:hypothetical protein